MWLENEHSKNGIGRAVSILCNCFFDDMKYDGDSDCINDFILDLSDSKNEEEWQETCKRNGFKANSESV